MGAKEGWSDTILYIKNPSEKYQRNGGFLLNIFFISDEQLY